MKIRALKCVLVLLVFFHARAVLCLGWADILPSLTKKIPARPSHAMTGTEFAKFASTLDRSNREEAILDQLRRGNLPDFLRKLKPVQLFHTFEDGRKIVALIFATPDYLAVGPDRDFLLIPMALRTATRIATDFGFILPTKKMVDAIFQQSAARFVPQPMAPGPQMTSTAYYVKHNDRIREQRLAWGGFLDILVSGHKKDVVITNRLALSLDKLAIYGWHRLSGSPIQPLSTVHGATYADYSHGIRLISDMVLIDDRPMSIYDVLEDPKLAPILSDEGPLRKVRQIMASSSGQPL